jgi:hypothetical protein
MKQTYKKLQKENIKMREELDKYLSLLEMDERHNCWDLINSLIENEIQEERCCNQ